MLLKYTDETKPFLTIFASFYPIIDSFFGVFSASWVNGTKTYDSIAVFATSAEGMYIVSYSVNGKTALDTIYAGVYKGVGTITDTNFGVTANAVLNCGSTVCHTGKGTKYGGWSNIVSGWSKTGHASWFWRGITGQLEFTEATEGGKKYGSSYSATCAPCHTTGFNTGPTNSGTSSGNFFDLWKATNFSKPDTTGTYGSTGSMSAFFSYDGSRWKSMDANQKQLATIGCESCHGPFVAANHMTPGWPKQNMVSREIGICAQCHDSPNNHAVVPQFLYSQHGIHSTANRWAYSSSSPNPRYCMKCHTRDGFMKRIDMTTQPPVYTFADNNTKYSCVMCHDPHKSDNNLVRSAQIENILTGEKFSKGGPGQICMYCHQARQGATSPGRPMFLVESYITSPVKSDTQWIDILAPFKIKRVNPTDATSSSGSYLSITNNPHDATQANMLLGNGAFEFNENFKASISGLETHANLEAGCATCHMSKPTVSGGYSLTGYHTYNMAGAKTNNDPTVFENTTACKECHGEEITKFDEIKSSNDYDGDNAIEDVQNEVKGLLEKVRNKIFVEKWGLRIRSLNTETLEPSFPSTTDSVGLAKYRSVMGDSNKVKIIYNYYFVTRDHSFGVHNAKYAIHLLSRSLLQEGIAGVKQLDEAIPRVYELSQNYPNPFNPTTSINFTIQKEAPVKIYIYNGIGQLVATIVDSYFTPGKYTATWDGLTSNGIVASSGAYFYKMVSGDFVQTKKMMLMK